MYRTAESNHRSNNSMNDILNRTEEHDDVFNTSYNTAQSLASSANGSSSSKAVLAALRALQDKIRRLEAERSQALDETAQLRLQLKNQEIEADHMKQKENLNAQKSLHEVKSAYDRLLTEKTDMEVRLAKLEERNRSAQHVAEDLQAKIKALEDEKQSSLQRARDLEHQQQNYDLQIKNAQQKEKEMAQTMVWESKRHEDEVTTLHHRVQTLQNDLAQSCQEKGTTDSKLMELDQLVSQLLAVNESLVAQLSGKPLKGASSPIKKKSTTAPTKKSTKKVTVPRAASVPTASYEAGKVPKFSMRQHSQLIPVKSDDIEQLRSMHKMYANMARSISGSGTPDGKRKGKGANSDGNSVVSARSTGSSGSRRMTRVSRKKAQLIERFEEDAAERVNRSSSLERSQSAGGGHYMHSSGSAVDVRLPKPSISFDYSAAAAARNTASNSNQSSSDIFDTSVDYFSNDASRPSDQGRDAFSPFTGGTSGASTPSGSILKNRSSSGQGSNLNHSGNNSNSVGTNKAEIQSVIASLEEEFDALNQQYRRLLSNASVPSTADVLHGLSARDGSGSAAQGVNGDLVQAQAEEIVSVIQKLHRKGEQLRSLKSP